MIKYLHVFADPNPRITGHFISFIEEYFDINEHMFLGNITSDKADASIKSRKNMYFLDSVADKPTIFAWMKDAEKVILHYVKYNVYTELQLAMSPRLRKKCMWLAWGGDLYAWRDNRGTIKSLINNFVRKSLRCSLKNRIAFFEGDTEVFQREFGSPKMMLHAPYIYLENKVFNRNFTYISPQESFEEKGYVTVLVGHRSIADLNHIEILHNLSSYDRENLKLIIPLSYGDMNYGDKVEDCAKELFGDRANVIRKLMSLDEYDKILESCDLAVFHTYRQVAYGNIIPLIHMKKKLFFPGDSSFYKFYNSKGVIVGKSDEIGNISFSNLIEGNENNKNEVYLSQDALNINKRIEEWKSVFDAVL